MIIPCRSMPCCCMLGLWFVFSAGLTAWPVYGEENLKSSEADAVLFEKEVRPLLVEHCIKCHGAEKQENGLRLDSFAGMVAGGDSGPALKSGAIEESLIVKAVRYEELEMPPSGKLPNEKIEALVTWISRGAHWPKMAGGEAMLRKKTGLTEEDRQYWAFQPLKKHAVPEIQSGQHAERAITDVDRFILSKLNSAGLTMAPQASRATLVRRLYFDLVGVPPTPAEAEKFLRDPRPDAYERLVDRLLDDVRYGQRWARHWLDLVRYAESDGYKQDAYRPTAYLYRDYVIDAFNRDKPYDQFVHEQLAGDEIDHRNPILLAATGYLRHWIYEYNQRDVRTQWSGILNDLTDVTGDVFMGLGFGCARCHDHKFDPILQKDYYRLQASFAGILPNDSVPYAEPETLAKYQQQLAQWEAATSEICREMAELEAPARNNVATKAIDKFPPEIRPWLRRMGDQRLPLEKQIADLAFRQVTGEWNALDFNKTLKDQAKVRWLELKAELAKFDHLKPELLPTILAAADVGPEAPPVFIPKSRTDAEPIEPAAIEVLGGQRLWPVPPSDGRSTGRRTALANWINSPENPLPHRVIVNRVWQYHFGTGLVGNASDFGRLGQPPTHPELLDWLANWFLESGRSLKQLHRLLVSSAVYRQASQHSDGEHCLQVDNANQLWWHFPARRLDAEQVRDAMLTVTGQMDGETSGPAAPHDSYRRTIFTKVMRNNPNPLLNVLDGPDGTVSVAKRNVTTTAIQSLLLANSPWPIGLSRNMALDLVSRTQLPRERIELAYQRAFQRSPSEEEVESAIGFLQLQAAAVRRESSDKPLAKSSKSTDNDAAIAGEQSASSVRPVEAARVELSSAEAARENPTPAEPESDPDVVALADLCHVLFNSSEFLYVD